MASLVERRRARPLLGTRVVVRARGAGPDDLDRAIDAAFAEIGQVHRLMSFHEPLSDVGRLNREAFGEPVRVDPRTWTVLAAARAFSAESEGAFDITMAPHLERQALLPTGAGCVDPEANWQDVELPEQGLVRFRRRLRLDLGGIAKGFAVDQAIEILQRHRLDSALVDAGGDMRAFGPQGFRIALRHPGGGGRSGWQTVLRNAALASSASGLAETVDGRPGEALVDPRQDCAVAGPACLRPRTGEEGDNSPHGVAVRAPAAMTADALTKVVLFAPPAVAETMLARHHAAAVRLIPSP